MLFDIDTAYVAVLRHLETGLKEWGDLLLQDTLSVYFEELEVILTFSA